MKAFVHPNHGYVCACCTYMTYPDAEANRATPMNLPIAFTYYCPNEKCPMYMRKFKIPPMEVEVIA